MKRQKLPIVVGGTNYYIEALLWDFLITEVRYIYIPYFYNAVIYYIQQDSN